MSTAIEEEIVAQQIEHLDWDPRCQVVSQYRLFPRLLPWWKIQRPCARPAHWILSYPCCGGTEFSCDRCRGLCWNTSEWVHCGRRFKSDMLTWTRI